MLVHGGDIAGYEAQYGATPLDFSANCSPLGLPQGVKAAIVGALDTADRYPDPLCRKLTAAIAAHEGVQPQQVLCGNGAADLIFRLALAVRPKAALLPAPTFAEYRQALELVGCAVEHHLLRRQDAFAVTPAILSRITPEVDILFLCQPNNPTGQAVEPGLLYRIADACQQNHVLLVADECFVDFLDDPQAHTLKSRLGQQGLVILKAFTKQYAMAGVRLGYCLSGDVPLLERMGACGQPWAVSSLAQAAGIAALEERDYLGRLRALVAAQRPLLLERLGELGCHCMGSQANYIFFAAPPGLEEKLRQRGVLIRSCANYPGLAQGYYRVAVRTQPENERLVQELAAALED